MPYLPAFGPELLLALGLLGLIILAGAWPRAVLLLALVSLAVRPELLLGGAALSHAWGIQHTLLLAALAGCAWRYGVHRAVNWPVLAFAAAFALSLLLGEVHPELTLRSMLGALGVLCLPWLFTQAALPPGSRRLCALVLALLPSLNLLVALLLQSPERVFGLFQHKEFEDTYRLVGAEGDPGLLAVLAFAGFAVALHESTRPGRSWAPLLATINLGIVVLTVTRMGILASLLLLATYTALSPGLRARLQRRRGLLVLGGAVVLALFGATLPSMVERVTSNQSWILSGGRDLIWPFYYEEFLTSPAFGRGFGAGFLDLTRVPRKSPHNEYLHLLVIAGVIGFILCLTAIAVWFRQLLARASPNDREFLLALLPAIAMFAVTEDVLTLSGALVLWVYLGSLLTRPGLAPWEVEARPARRPGRGPAPRAAVPVAAESEPLPDGPEPPAWAAADGPRLGGVLRSLDDRQVAVPEAAILQRHEVEGAASMAARREGWARLEAGARPAPVPPAAAVAGEPLEPPDTRPGGGGAPGRGYYWVKTFPTARRVLRATAADKLVNLLLLGVLASLAIGSGDVFGERLAGLGAITWHKLVLLGAVSLVGLCCGLRLLPNWVVIAMLAIVPVNLLLAERLDGLSPVMMVKTVFGLLVPWIFIHVVFDARSRIHYVVAIALASIVSSALGLFPDFALDFNRFGGATNAAFLGASAFFGFAISAHEYGQRRHLASAILAFACLVIVIFSGSRTAWLSSLIFVIVLYLKSAALREAVTHRYTVLMPGAIFVIIVMALYVPFMESRFFSFDSSGRDEIWEFFLYELNQSPLFGRGLGASEVLRLRYDTPSTHNEYLRLLVEVGIVGFVIYLAAVVAWFRALLRLISTENRAFVWAMVPCLALYGATDNILAMVAALAVFVYFGVVLDDRSRPAGARRPAVAHADGEPVAPPDLPEVVLDPRRARA